MGSWTGPCTCIHIIEAKNGGNVITRLSNQIAENLPLFKLEGCHLEDPTNTDWPDRDLTPWGYSTYNKNMTDRPPQLTCTMRPGKVHTGENGERQVYWTQYIRNSRAHPLPPGFSFIEYVEDEATDMDSSARPGPSGAITVFDAHTTQQRSRVASTSACTMHLIRALR